MRTFPAADSNLRQFFFCRRVPNSLKTPEDDRGSPNLASAFFFILLAQSNYDHYAREIAANPLRQGLL